MDFPEGSKVKAPRGFRVSLWGLSNLLLALGERVFDFTVWGHFPRSLTASSVARSRISPAAIGRE